MTTPTTQTTDANTIATDTATTDTDSAPDAAARPITADIFHDLVCPWCRIGLANLRQALADWDGPPVELHWHPFLLNPDTPVEGEPFHATLAGKFGQDPAPMLERVSEAGQPAGLTFRWDLIERMPNSVAAHILYAVLPPEHRTGMIDRLHAAYFEEGRDIGDPATLRAIAEGYGLDGEAVERALAEPKLRDAITSEAAQASELGVSGVPLVIFDNRAAVSGAQPAAAFRATLEQVVATRDQPAGGA